MGNFFGCPYTDAEEAKITFFTEWSKGMRSDLLAVGYDNMATTDLRKTTIRDSFGNPVNGTGQFASARPYYTRSFPILASTHGGSDPEYGDQLYMHTAPAAQVGHTDWIAEATGSGSLRKLTGHPFAFIHGDGDVLRWGQPKESADPVTFNIAKGFWSGGTYPWGGAHLHKPFIDKLRIYRNGYGVDHASPVYKEFAIEYQINLLYRVKVKQTVVDATISDTDWLVVHPRGNPINYVDKGKDTSATSRRSANEVDQPLNFFGTNTDRIDAHDAQTDIWIEGGGGGPSFDSLELFFDGYTKDPGGGGIHQWSTLLHRSTGIHSGAFFQKSWPGGGIFKQLNTGN